MEDATRSDIPVTGKFIKAIIDNFTQAPIKGDDSWEINSIGTARNSIVATDSYSAIIIGEPGVLHTATQRKEALLEAERAKLYSEPVRLEDISRNVNPESGESKPMPSVQAVINSELAAMKPLASMDPTALLAIGKAASAAGALSVELFQPDGDAKRLGFQFKFYPADEHMTLFSSWEGPITARGVFKVASAAGVKAAEQEEILSEEIVAPPERKRAPKAAPVLVVEDEPVLDVEIGAVTIPVDVHLRSVRGGFNLPPLSILESLPDQFVDAGDYGDAIINTLKGFGMTGRIAATHVGPTVTQYELDIPGNISIKRIASMSDEFQLRLGVRSVRIEAPIPGKKAIGIEVPNRKARTVTLREICSTAKFTQAEPPLYMALGQDISGRPVYGDLSSMPHLLIAGATNAGKSIGIATILSSLLMRNTPKDLRLVLIDPKRVELSLFEGIPHLMCPVVTDTKDVAGVLRALVREMERRYELLEEQKLRNILSWNAKAADVDKMPYIVIVIDELADLMMQAKAEVESVIVMLAQKARAVGIHLIVATQRPSVDIITGLIKSNIPSRIAFAVASQIDSRVILDQGGAEKLLGRGDMIFLPIDSSKGTRVQGAYVSEEEVGLVCQMWREQGGTNYELTVTEPAPAEDGEEDPLYDKAVSFAREKSHFSTSMLQREYSIGYQRAHRLLERMEREEIVGPADGAKPRQVLVGAGH